MNEGFDCIPEASAMQRSSASNSDTASVIRAFDPSLRETLKHPKGRLLEQIPSGISCDQLVHEIKRLYRSLEIVEKQRIALQQTHMSDKGKFTKPKEDDFRVLTARHGTLLNIHHDLLLATQHPAASEKIRRLAAERQIPYRMWKHGIHAYLEFLRPQLPDSLQFMESFIHLSYQMLAFLYETVRPFENAWAQCVGDLARYRIAIGSQSADVRDTWTEVARYWYTKASNNQPYIGRLYHHLGIVARPNLLQQLHFYSKALCCVTPFPQASLAIKALFETAKQEQADRTYEQSKTFRTIEQPFIQAHGCLYEARSVDDLKLAQEEVIRQLRKHLPRATNSSLPEMEWKHYGVLLAIANIAACFRYGATDNPLRQIIDRVSCSALLEGSTVGMGIAVSRTHELVVRATQDVWISTAIGFMADILDTVLAQHKAGQKALVPFIHVHLLFLDVLTAILPEKDMLSLLGRLPWARLVNFLNDIGSIRGAMTDKVQLQTTNQQARLGFNERDARPLMEDHAIKGLFWSRNQFPTTWFDSAGNDDLPYQESASSEKMRAQRALRLAIRVATVNFPRSRCWKSD